MRTVTELSTDDLKNIVAMYFGTDLDKVEVSVKEACVGFGMGEHMEAVPVVKVIKEESVKNE